MQHLFFAFLAPAAAIATLAALFYAWKGRREPGNTPLIAYLVMTCASLLAGLLEVAAPGESDALFWARSGYLFLIGLPVAWLAFALEYAGLTRWADLRRFWIFLIEPATLLAHALTSAQNSLIWSSVQFERQGSFWSIQVGYGPLAWLHWLYATGLLVSVAFLVAQANRTHNKVHTFRTAWAAFCVILPLVSSAIYLLEFIPGLTRDYSPIAFAISGLVFSMGVFKPSLFNQAQSNIHSWVSGLQPDGAGRAGPLRARSEEIHKDLSRLTDYRTGSAGDLSSKSIQQAGQLEALVKSRTRNLSVLYEITSATNLPLDLPELLKNVLATIVNIFGLRAAILHLDEVNYGFFTAEGSSLSGPIFDDRHALWGRNGSSGQTLFLVSYAGFEAAQAAIISSMPDSDAPWQQVLTQDRVIIQDQMPVFVQVGEVSLSACVCVPVRAKGRLQGVLSVLDESIEHLLAEDVALLVAIADHVGGAVERARLRRMAEQAAVIEERQRLARDLHDTVTQTLYSLVLFAEAGKDALASGNMDRVGNHLVRLRDTAQQALKEMRLLIYELRPLALQHAGLVSALNHRLETVEQRAGIETRLEVESLAPLPERVEAGLYGIAQEALNNVLKHARATQVVVRLSVESEGVELEIIDNGQGFSGRENIDRGIGLTSMRERARALGGSVSIQSEEGRGARVFVSIRQEAYL